MRDNRQYLIVGLFIIITVSILIGVWLWFSASNRQEYNTYVAIFHEPVDGVTSNSLITYNGVNVGQVKSIQLDEKNPRNIYVYLNVLQSVSINKDTYAVLKSQGITGMTYIALNLPQDSKSIANLIPNKKPPYTEIITHPSLLYSLTSQAQSVAGNIQDVSGQVKNMLTQQNLDHLAHILSNLDKVSASVASRSADIEQGLDLMVAILNNVKRNTDNLNKTFESIESLTVVVSQTTKNANKLVSSVQDTTLQNINSVLLPNLNHTINNLNQSTSQLEQFLILLNENPSALIRGKTPDKPGPGE